MKQLYRPQLVCWLTIACLLSSVVGVRAQTTAPVVQWQRVIEGGNLTATSTIRAVKASNEGYGVLTGKQLVRISATGAQLWQKDVPSAYADSTSSRTVIQQTLGVAASQDGGFVVLGLDVASHYYLTKLDSTGASVWTKTVARTYAGSLVQVTQNGLIATSDGGFLVVGSYTDVLAYLTLTKLNAEGVIVSQWRVKFSGPSPLAIPLIQQILPLPGANYLLVGRAASRTGSDSEGLSIKLDKQYNVVWQQVYAQMYALQSAVVNPGSDGVYTAVGTGVYKTSQAITIAPNGANDGALLASFPGMSTVVSMVSDGTGAVTVLDANPINNGDFRLSNGKLPATFRWTKNFGGSGVDVPTDFLATDDGGYLAVGSITSTNGDVVGKSTNAVAAWVIKLGNTAQATTLRLTVLSYDCQTGLIRFQAGGGNGLPITYSTPGISRANATDTFGTVDLAVRNGAKVVTIQATQSNQTVSSTFDIGAYCSTSSSTSADSLRMLTPTYSCQTGALTINTGSGNGSPIDYAIAGILDWTTNPNQVLSESLRTSSSVQPLVLLARQSGRVVSYVLDIKAVCGRARIGETTDLAVTILGNPSHETALVQIVGAGGQLIDLRLYDAAGRLVEERTIEQATDTERQTFDIRQQAVGTLLLHVEVNDQTRLVRVMKQ